MSYCRWSSNNWNCDVYCYEGSDGFTTHVARNRVVGEVPPLPAFPPQDADEATVHAWAEQAAAAHKRQSDFLETCQRVAIGLPWDGHSFYDPDLTTFLERLTVLRDLGYTVPQYVFDAIEQELLEDLHD